MVPWATLDAGTVEALVGHLLARRHPNSVRLKPGRGDGGIDVFVPLGARRVDVYQVKHFQGPIQWSKVKASLARAAANEHVDIRRWKLTVARQPTPTNVEKLRELDASVPFPCEWFDGDHIDGLAADYPTSIEYYLGDARARLEDSISRLHDLTGLAPSTGGALLEPTQSTPWLSTLFEALNRDDPHFRYEFYVGLAPAVLARDTPLLVASSARPLANGCITFHIFGRYNGATDDRPAPVTFSIDPAGMTDDLWEAWRRALRYGTPIEFPASAIAGVRAELPGGLGGEADEAVVRISPALSPPADVEIDRLRLTILDAEDKAIASAVIKVRERTRGLVEPGVRMYATSVGGAFDIELLSDLDGWDGQADTMPEAGIPMRFNLSVRPWVGLSPNALLPEARFLQALRAPNTLRFGLEYGPPSSAAAELTEPVGGATEWACAVIAEVAYLEANVDGQLVMPDLETLTGADAEAIWRAAHLAQGKVLVDDWTDAVRLPDLPSTEDEVAAGVYAVREEAVVIGQYVVRFYVKYTWLEAKVTRDDDGTLIAPANPPGRRRSELA